MSKIIKTKFLCITGSRTAPRGSGGWEVESIKWQDRFIVDKWYDGEYETWSWEDGYRVNDGWRRYWVINEQGDKEEISRSQFNIIFETKVEELRDNKIDQILKNDQS